MLLHRLHGCVSIEGLPLEEGIVVGAMTREEVVDKSEAARRL